MAAGNIADRHAGLHRLGNHGQLQIGGETPPASDAGDHFDLRERVGHRRIPRLIPRPSGYCRCPVETGCSSVENCADRDLLNKAIIDASSLGPQTVGYIGDRTLVTGFYDDLGYVDYVKLSFALFGRQVESIYYTFFVLLSFSTIVFIITFGFRVDALAVLLCTLIAFVIEMRTAIFISDM